MPTPPFKAALSHKPGKILNWRWGSGKLGFEDREPSQIASHEIATIVASEDGERILAISPDGTTTLSIQEDGSMQIRDGHVDDKYERAFYYGNKFLSYASDEKEVKRVFSLYDPVTKEQYPFQLSGGGGGGGSQVSPLEVVNLDFVSNGRIEKLRCVTAFTMWQLAIHGEWGQISDYVGYMGERGFRDFRAFGCWGNTMFNPLNHNNAYEALSDLDIYLNHNGKRLLLTVFTDQIPGSPVLMTQSNQDIHLISCVQALRDRRTARIEFVNEYFKNWMRPYPVSYPASVFDGLVASWSTWVDNHDPQEVGPNLSYVNKHTGGFDEEWSRKDKVCVEAQTGQGGGLGEYPPARKPCICGEKVRIGEGSIPREHADSTGLDEMYGGGGCLHGHLAGRGGDSELQSCSLKNMTDTARDCIDAASKMFNIVPDHISATGEYRNSGGGIVEHDDSKMLRTYCMVDGNNAYVVRVKGRKPGMELKAINDWRIVSKMGYEENFIHLTR